MIDKQKSKVSTFFLDIKLFSAIAVRQNVNTPKGNARFRIACHQTLLFALLWHLIFLNKNSRHVDEHN
jgi:hypothetical protein